MKVPKFLQIVVLQHIVAAWFMLKEKGVDMSLQDFVLEYRDVLDKNKKEIIGIAKNMKG